MPRELCRLRTGERIGDRDERGSRQAKAFEQKVLTRRTGETDARHEQDRGPAGGFPDPGKAQRASQKDQPAAEDNRAIARRKSAVASRSVL